MTGRHPIQLGLQHGVIRDAIPDALPINETMLPSLLRDSGYRTHFIGKWHLGFHQPRFTPERRGFDTAFGYYTGNAEYWNHTSPCWGCGNYTGVDLHFANATHWVGMLGASGYYSTELFGREAVRVVEAHADASPTHMPPLFLYLAFEAVHGASSCFVHGQPPSCEHPDDDELHVPERYERAQAHIVRRNRRLYAGMVGALDEAVGNVTTALHRRAMLDSSLVLFTSDNGAPFKHLGGDTMSNWPLRGGKAELWEGGVRGACFLAGGALPRAAAGVRSSALVHASDLLPTLLAFAKVEVPSRVTDVIYGIDASRLLREPSRVGRYEIRSELLHNADPISGARRSGLATSNCSEASRPLAGAPILACLPHRLPRRPPRTPPFAPRWRIRA